MITNETEFFTAEEAVKLNLYDANRNLNTATLRRLAKNKSAWLMVQSLVEIMERGGIEDCAKALHEFETDSEILKNLAYRLYNISEKKNWAKEGTGYNNLIVEWQRIVESSANLKTVSGNLFEQ